MYYLLKNNSTDKAFAKVHISDNPEYYIMPSGAMLPRQTVENNTEWFISEEEYNIKIPAWLPDFYKSVFWHGRYVGQMEILDLLERQKGKTVPQKEKFETLEQFLASGILSESNVSIF